MRASSRSPRPFSGVAATDAAGKTFLFTVTGPGAESGKTASVTIDSDGVSGTAVVSGLKNGKQYTVTEAALDIQGYTNKGVDFGSGATSATVVAKATEDEASTVAVSATNTYAKSGELVVRKSFAEDSEIGAGDLTDAQKAAMKFTVKDAGGVVVAEQTYDKFVDGAWSIKDLAVGTYTVTETAPDIDDYTLTVKVDGATSASGSATATIVGGEKTTVAFDNNYARNEGFIKIAKAAVNADDDAIDTDDKEFTFRVTGDGIEGYKEVKVKAGDTVTVSGLLAGAQYTVTEVTADGATAVDGYEFKEVTYSASAVAAASESEATAVTVAATNHYADDGVIKVTKSVVGTSGTDAADREFSFTVTGPEGYSETFTLKAGETKTIDGLELGATYHVAETGDTSIEGYAYDAAASVTEGDVVAAKTADAAVAFTAVNAYEDDGVIKVVKAFDGIDAAVAACKTFKFEVTDAEGNVVATPEVTVADDGTCEPAVVRGLKLASEYRVAEVGETATEGYTYEGVSYGGGEASYARVTPAKTAESAVAVVATNHYADNGVIKITKSVTVDGEDDANAIAAGKTFSFQVSDSVGDVVATAKVNVAADGTADTAVVKGLKYGETYTVTEITADGAVDVADYAYVGTTYSNGSAKGNTATAALTEDAADVVTVTAINDYTPNTVITHFEFMKYYYADKALVDSANFTFTLESVNADGTPAAGTPAVYTVDEKGAAWLVDAADKTVSDTASTSEFEADGNAYKSVVVFKDIAYKTAGTWYYKVTENDAAKHSGWDTSVYLVKVEVAADERGALQTPEVTYLRNGAEEETDAEHAFINNSLVNLSSYSLDAPAEDQEAEKMVWVDPKISKVLVNGSMEGEEFTFTLTEINSDGSAVSGGLVKTQTNDKNGLVDFDKLGIENPETGEMSLFQFTEAGEHWYVIEETGTQPGESGYNDDVNYSGEKIYYYINVYEDADNDGSLMYEAWYCSALDKTAKIAGTPTITNSMKSLNVKVRKTSANTGKALEGAVYTLWAYNADGADAYVAEGTPSDSDGWIYFNDVTLLDGYEYYFKEQTAPAGYLVDSYRSDLFKKSDLADDSSSLSSVSDAKTLTYAKGVSDEQIKFEINKVDSYYKTYVSGAQMALIDQATGETVASWTTGDGAVEFAATLDDGRAIELNKNYILRELSAPAKYYKAADTVFYLDDEGAVHIVSGSDAEAKGSNGINLSDERFRIVIKDSDGTIIDNDADEITVYKYIYKNYLAQTGDQVLALVIGAIVLIAIVAAIVALRARRKSREE